MQLTELPSPLRHPPALPRRLLQRKATVSDTSLGVANRLSRELGRALLKNSFSMVAASVFSFAANCSRNPETPSDAVGPTNTEFTVTPVPAVVSAIPRATATCAVFVMP